MGNTAPCIHGDLCRAYMRKFGIVRIGTLFNHEDAMCIYSTKCPDCPFYEPKSEAIVESIAQKDITVGDSESISEKTIRQMLSHSLCASLMGLNSSKE